MVAAKFDIWKLACGQKVSVANGLTTLLRLKYEVNTVHVNIIKNI